MNAEQDQELWDALVEAERQCRQRRADFYQNAQDPKRILATALAGQAWQVATALEYLRAFSRDSTELLPQLVELSLSQKWALAAREAIASIPPNLLWPALTPVVSVRMHTTDPDELRRLAELLAHLQAWPQLTKLVSAAEAVDDPEVRDLADDFASRYAQFLSAGRRMPTFPARQPE